MSYPYNTDALRCRGCGHNDRFYETGVAKYGWACDIVLGSAGFESEENGRKIEYFEHIETDWRCGACDRVATSLEELVSTACELEIGERVLLPHGTWGRSKRFERWTVTKPEQSSSSTAGSTALGNSTQPYDPVSTSFACCLPEERRIGGCDSCGRRRMSSTEWVRAAAGVHARSIMLNERSVLVVAAVAWVVLGQVLLAIGGAAAMCWGASAVAIMTTTMVLLVRDSFRPPPWRRCSGGQPAPRKPSA